MKIFITGGCGQIGSHMAEIFLARGDHVLAIDNFETGRRLHLPESHAHLEFVEGSISDRQLVNHLMDDYKPDVLVHTAASYKDPDDWHSDVLTNGIGGINLIQAAVANNVSRFIYFQTALVYGIKPLKNPIPLHHPRNQANSSYAISKAITEDYLTISGLDYVTFRLANVIGPRNVSGPLPIFYERLRSGKSCFVTQARRDFVFVKDLVPVAVRAADGVGKGAYHFSSGTDVAIKELYDAVVGALKLNHYPEPELRPLGNDEAASILLDPSRTFEEFGRPNFSTLQDTVAAAVEYYETFGVHGGHTHLRQ